MLTNENKNVLQIINRTGKGARVESYAHPLGVSTIECMGKRISENYYRQNTFRVRDDGQTTILTKGYNAAFTVKQFNTASSTPTVFRIEGTGDTRIYTQSTLTPFSIETGTGTVFRVTGNRRVGIGTGSPNCGLEIEPEQNINGVCVKVNHTQPYGFGFTFEGQNAQAETKAYRVWWNNKERFVVYANGKTIIGDQTNLTNSALLNINCINNQRAIDIYDQQTNSVNFRVYSSGFVYAREIEVTTSIFPDYVFEKNYNLMNINELEAYILKHKKLPGFEKADYYIKNGLKAGEIIVKQQEKIEELTLYIIELEKRLKKIELKLQK